MLFRSLGAGTYSVTVTWATSGSKTISVNYTNSSGCSALAPKVQPVTVYTYPTPTLTGSLSVCAGATGIAYTTEAGKSGYVWAVTGGSITSGMGTSSVTVDWTTSGSQSISVTYTGQGGCTPAPTTKTVTVSPAPGVTIAGNNSACQGDTVIYTASVTNGGSDPAYHWFVNGNPVVNGLVNNNGLVCYYPFNGNANDASGNGNNGTVYGASLSADRYGIANSAYSFNGINNYIDISSGAIPTNPAAMTECAWVKTTGSGTIVILTRRHADYGADWATLMETGGKGCISVDAGGYRNDLLSATSLNDGNWHFLVGRKNNSSYSVFVDGQIQNSTNDAYPLSGSSLHLHIGHHGAWNNWFNGMIDDVSIYNRSLSNAEILNLYNSSNSVFRYVPNNGDNVYCTVTTSAGCSGTSNTINMSVLPAPAPTILGSESVCQNSTGNVYTTESGKTAYQWTVSSGGSITSGGTSADDHATVTWSGLGTKTVSVNYANPNGCHAAAATVKNVTVYAPPIPVISGSVTICGIPSAGNVYSTAAGMTGYTWSVSSGGSITAGGTPGDNSVTVTWNTTGAKTVSVSYTDANGCATVTPTVKNVIVNALPVPAITGPALICGIPSAGNVYSTASGMSGYSWTVSSGGSIISGAGSQSISVSWTTTGAKTVSVTYIDGNGCSPAAPTSYPVNVFAFTAPAITGSGPICGIPSAGNI